MTHTQTPDIRHDWTTDQALVLFQLPFNELVYQAQTLHRKYFQPEQVQLSSLLNIKTGACPEDCSYCSQSARVSTGLQTEPLMPVAEIVTAAEKAKTAGASRFCMGAAWKRPNSRDFEKILDIVESVHKTGIETCMTLGMLSQDQAQALKVAGLDYYNHNLDTSEAYYPQVVTTRSYGERLDTLENVRQAGLKVCCGGILGMGETIDDRAALMVTLANLTEHPESVPINQLVKVDGTALEDAEELPPLDMVRAIAVARIMMPKSWVRLSAGRSAMSDELQSLCFLAGANSVFYGETLLTTANMDVSKDQQLIKDLGMTAV
ncbi:biotin synthase BioB [Candidatus Venteria ishoeyi]|uniref:Biotin synthase n=1 Tax=Candidatus Venteria ishoeyi TaxID=1899563 RepID=A0A1H6FC83_9GAMM|nr:biotin synthase BioB [Candidatus Venteria ishoeyi]MDM8547087.1 biotin synthase BioB [Candidatus Venteria ishoeyi]SEH06894.1 Biotin synthase [Candidatus Venteria ishoeyi]SEH07700.1 Biotin synthase [Candidatus Venteria ishoeyi]